MGKNKDQVKTFLSSDFKIINNWFYENFMVLNPEKSNFLCIGQKTDDAETLNFNNLAIKNNKEVEILGIKLDRNMNFILILKIYVESRSKTKRCVKNQFIPRLKKKSFIVQVNDKTSVYYYPLVWMFCSRQSNNLIKFMTGVSG